MARWILLGLTLLGVFLVLTTKSMPVFVAGLILGIVGFFGFVMVLAADRVSAAARPESSMAAVDDLAALRKRSPASASLSSAATQSPAGTVEEKAGGAKPPRETPPQQRAN